MQVGVLALQGDIAEHIAMLRSIEPLETVEVRLPGQLEAIDGLILPGGESTTIGKLMVEYGLLEPLRRRIASGMPVFGTCAGAILLARDIGGLAQPLIGVMDLVIRRNAFGRQLQSFEANLPIAAIGDPPLRAVFIRAPAIEAVGTGVEVLARLQDGTIVAARERNMLVTAFHPELTRDDRLHRFFLRMVASSRHLAARSA
jgi:5'-phosphate synthase pdxT subunit